MNYDNIELIKNEAEKRFQLSVEGGTAFIMYEMAGEKVINLYHTEVHTRLEGKGVGAALVKKVLEYCCTKGLKVMASCPFVASYIIRHPDWEFIIVPDGN